MREADVHKKTFRTHIRYYEHLMIPFVLCNAPSTFQVVMTTIFMPYLRRFVLIFFDDILVFSKTVEDHRSHMETILTVLEE